MDERCKASLRKFFSASAVAFFIIYLIFMAISLFSVPLSMPVISCLVFVVFFLFILSDAVNTKARELGDVGHFGLLSLPVFTILVIFGYAVMVYKLRVRKIEDALWIVVALLDSTLFDISLRALRKLKTEM